MHTENMHAQTCFHRYTHTYIYTHACVHAHACTQLSTHVLHLCECLRVHVTYWDPHTLTQTLLHLHKPIATQTHTTTSAQTYTSTTPSKQPTQTPLHQHKPTQTPLHTQHICTIIYYTNIIHTACTLYLKVLPFPTRDHNYLNNLTI